MPAYFRWLEVENIRCFGEKRRLELTSADGKPAKWTVLLGDNGVGKTTLLQCLYSMAPRRSWFDGPEVSVLPRGFMKHGWIAQRVGLRREQVGRVSAEIRYGDVLSGSRATKLASAYLLVVEDDGSGADSFAKDVGPILCCAYGATRQLDAGRLEGRDQREEDGGSLLASTAPLINAAEWLLQADYAARTHDTVRAKLRRDEVQNALVALLPEVDKIRQAGLDEEPPEPRVEVQTPYGWVGLRDLSLGYQTMIAWVVDLAARMFEVYSDSPNPLHEAAIVLVDEIDLHLHPRWQRDITSYLDELFPNVQFIVTALVLSSSRARASPTSQSSNATAIR